MTFEWIKISKPIFDKLLYRCEVTKTNSSRISFFDYSNGEIIKNYKYKVYPSSGGDHLFIKKNKKYIWLQYEGDESARIVPPCSTSTEENDVTYCIGSYF
tara:strand:- start:164 stop:463 length:300 start_codon:yes stop_codon:yes gene_type:complete